MLVLKYISGYTSDSPLLLISIEQTASYTAGSKNKIALKQKVVHLLSTITWAGLSWPPLKELISRLPELSSSQRKFSDTYLKKGLSCNPSLLIKALSICSKWSFIILTCNTLKKKIRISAILFWCGAHIIGRIFNFVVLGGCGLAWWEGVATGVKLSGFIAIIVSNA